MTTYAQETAGKEIELASAARRAALPIELPTQPRNQRDAQITNVIIGITIVVFLVGGLQSILVGLAAAAIVGGFVTIMWCSFFRAPTTHTRLVLGLIFIPLYLCYVRWVWVAFDK